MVQREIRHIIGVSFIKKSASGISLKLNDQPQKLN